MEAHFRSSDVQLPLKLLLLNSHGSSPEMGASEPPLSYARCLSLKSGIAASDMYVSCALHTHGREHGVSRTYNTAGSRLRWNEWVSFRGKYSSLSPDAHISLALCGSDGPRSTKVIGTARLALFDETQQLRTGVIKVRLELTGSVASPRDEGRDDAHASEEEEIAWLDGLASRHEKVLSQPDASLDWLNRPTFAFIEERQQVRLHRPTHFICFSIFFSPVTPSFFLLLASSPSLFHMLSLPPSSRSLP